jgi:hypothetical protein
VWRFRKWVYSRCFECGKYKDEDYVLSQAERIGRLTGRVEELMVETSTRKFVAGMTREREGTRQSRRVKASPKMVHYQLNPRRVHVECLITLLELQDRLSLHLSYSHVFAVPHSRIYLGILK